MERGMPPKNICVFGRQFGGGGVLKKKKHGPEYEGGRRSNGTGESSAHPVTVDSEKRGKKRRGK